MKPGFKEIVIFLALSRLTVAVSEMYPSAEIVIVCVPLGMFWNNIIPSIAFLVPTFGIVAVQSFGEHSIIKS